MSRLAVRGGDEREPNGAAMLRGRTLVIDGYLRGRE